MGSWLYPPPPPRRLPPSGGTFVPLLPPRFTNNPPLHPNPQAEKAELKSALLESIASALYYNPQLTLQWTEANNATQVRRVCVYRTQGAGGGGEGRGGGKGGS